jgi:hypothetical protein
LCKYILMLIRQILDIVVVLFLYCNQKSSRSLSSRKAALNFSNRSTDYLRIVVPPLRMVIHALNKFPRTEFCYYLLDWNLAQPLLALSFVILSVQRWANCRISYRVSF